MITHTDRSAVITVLFWQLLLVIDFLKEATNLINFTVIDGDITEVQQAATHLVWRLVTHPAKLVGIRRQTRELTRTWWFEDPAGTWREEPRWLWSTREDGRSL